MYTAHVLSPPKTLFLGKIIRNGKITCSIKQVKINVHMGTALEIQTLYIVTAKLNFAKYRARHLRYPGSPRLAKTPCTCSDCRVDGAFSLQLQTTAKQKNEGGFKQSGKE